MLIRFSALTWLLLQLAAAPALAQGDGASGRLHEDPVWRLRRAQTQSDSNVMLVLAAKEGRTADAARAVESVGGRIRYRSDRVGYLRALVPIRAVQKLMVEAPIVAAEFDLARFCLDDVCASAIDDGAAVRGEERPPVFPVGGAEPVEWRAQSWQQGTWNEDPFNRPYHPAADLGTSAWKRLYPTYDGRGVTIGHVEGFVDLLLPEFGTATTLSGEPTIKVVEYRLTDDPDDVLEGNRTPHPWFRTTEVAPLGRRFAIGEHTFLAPREGRFRFGYFNAGQMLCRSIDPTRVFMEYNRFTERRRLPLCRFGVLWDAATGEVWLDADRDRDFSNDRALRDYRVRQDVGIVGRDNPATRARESFSVVAQIDSVGQRVAILVGTHGHATMDAGSAAASVGGKSRAPGVAPVAQLAVYIGGYRYADSYGSTYRYRSKGQVVEAIIAAFLDPRVDIVFSEGGNFAFRDSSRPMEGKRLVSLIVNRLTAATGKPFVAPAGNSMNEAGVQLPGGNLKWGFAAGASTSRESWWINQGIRVPHQDNLHQVSNFGPGDDGSIQPTVLAPSGWLSTEQARSDVRGYNVYRDGLYLLPPGYIMGGGTSQATPTLTGALALLISAAKQEKVPYDARRIWLAVTNSARFAPHIPAYQQGHGFIDVGAGFELLKEYVKRPPTISITSRAPVRTGWSHELGTPHEGVGLFEREGWRAGMKERRVVTLTRTSGPAGAMTFSLSWQGNDGTFATQPSVVLPLGQPVRLAIDVAPKTPGYHSAILNVDHPSVPGHVHRVMAAIVAAERFEAPDYRVAVKDTVDRPGPMASYYFDVPAGVTALYTEFKGEAGNRFGLATPYEANLWDNSCEARCSYELPEAGVWRLGYYLFGSFRNDGKGGVDLRWANPTDAPDPPVAFEFTTRLIGVDIDVSRAQGGADGFEISARMTNRFAAFNGGLVSGALGSGRVERGRLERGAQRVYEVSVPVGAELLEVALPSMSVPGAIELSLLDCMGESCVLEASARGRTKERVLRRANPKAGQWRVVLDAIHAPAGGAGVDYEYRDIVTDPALGGVVSTDRSTERGVGASWDANVLVWRSGASLAEGREPFVVLTVEAVMPNSEPFRAGILTKALRSFRE